MDPRITIAIISFIVGFIFGLFSSLVFKKENVSTERFVSIFLCVAWLSTIAADQVLGRESTLPYLAHFVGFGATGSLIGLTWADMLKNFILKK